VRVCKARSHGGAQLAGRLCVNVTGLIPAPVRPSPRSQPAIIVVRPFGEDRQDTLRGGAKNE